MVGVSGVTAQVDDAAPAYCTDQPLRSIGAVPGLNSSMKSFRYGAFVLPPPPKTWEITMCDWVSGVGAGVGVGIGVGEAVGEGIGVAVGDGEGEGIGVGVGVGGGGTRNTEPSSLVPGLNG